MNNNFVITGTSSIEPNVVTPKKASYNNSNQAQFFLTDFETRSVLGKKGTRNMDKLTGLTIHCVDQVMSGLELQRNSDPQRIGLVVGTAQGSMDSIVRFTYETLAHNSPDYVNPALFPNTVMNCAAGQSAIWHGLQGPNTTISCGELSSFSAFNYALMLLKNNYADTIITGGSEELSEVNIAAKKVFSEQVKTSARFSEGCAFFVVESRETAEKFRRSPVATINAIRVGFNPKNKDATALSQLLGDVLEDASISPDNIALVSYSGSWPQTKDIEKKALGQQFGNSIKTIQEVVQYEVSGNSVSSQNALQLATVLTELKAGKSALLFAQDLKGNIGAMVITRNSDAATTNIGEQL